MKLPSSAPTWALLFGAATWGLVWYPYRLLALEGLDGIHSTLITYSIALAFGIAAFPRAARSLLRAPPLAIVMALAVGWSNLLLHERLDARGFLVMAVAFAGAMIMLWRPGLGFPWPASRAEWMGVGAGFCFALGNVLVRRLDDMGDAAIAAYVLAGEVMRPQDWIGGVLIVAATLLPVSRPT